MSARAGFHPDPSLRGKTFLMGWRGWALIAALALLAAYGVAMLYSVAGDPAQYTSETSWWNRGDWDPWASRHAVRFAIGLSLMLTLAAVPIRAWLEGAYPIYFVSLVLLVMVELFGATQMGATRWLSIGSLNVQPSELMKLALVLALAKHYHDLDGPGVNNPLNHLAPLAMILIPAALIAKQPDLGTALLVTATGGVMVLLAGVPWRIIFAAAMLGAVGLVLLFSYGLHDYQRARLMTFFNPSADPMGAGYHILQSKIAIGSGGLDGKGFGAGTQTQLDFLPEKHTDFIFTVIGEELGFVGGVGLLALIVIILALAISMAVSARHHFGRLAALGAAATYAFYVFINVAMVMGLVPVVGVPLPLVSYGGTVMIAVMAGFGLILNVHLHRDAQLPKSGGFFT